MNQTPTYHDWIQQSKGLLFSPRRFWKGVDAHQLSTNYILSSFLLPWLGLTTMVVFAAVWVNHPQQAYLEVLKQSVVVFARLFFSVFIAAWSIEKLNAAQGNAIPQHAALALVAFPAPILCVDAILSALLPELLITKLLLLYTVPLLYLGGVYFLNLKKTQAFFYSLLIFAFFMGTALAAAHLLMFINHPIL